LSIYLERRNILRIGTVHHKIFLVIFVSGQVPVGNVSRMMLPGWWTGFETFRIRQGVGQAAHTLADNIHVKSMIVQIYSNTHRRSQRLCGLQPTPTQGNNYSIYHHTHGSQYKHGASIFKQKEKELSSFNVRFAYWEIKNLNKYFELQKAYDRHDSTYHNPAEKKQE
jgi:hypothetical protein